MNQELQLCIELLRGKSAITMDRANPPMPPEVAAIYGRLFAAKKLGTTLVCSRSTEPLSFIVWGGMLLGAVIAARKVKFLQS